VKIEFDPAKSEKNARERGLPFHAVDGFDWETAQFEEDARFRYPELRIVAAGFMDSRLHVLCFTPIDGGIRVISFRKANDREVRKYDEKKTAD
jgi:uncharacterized DUF497 family protein